MFSRRDQKASLRMGVLPIFRSNLGYRGEIMGLHKGQKMSCREGATKDLTAFGNVPVSKVLTGDHPGIDNEVAQSAPSGRFVGDSTAEGDRQAGIAPEKACDSADEGLETYFLYYQFPGS